jgi:hypothetical protein
MNDCWCNIPDGGYCARHDVEKSAHLVKLCQTNERYFLAWEENRGPGQRNRDGLGDRVARGLEAVGITKQRVSRVLRRPCGCGKRQRFWNKVGRKVGIGVSTSSPPLER